MFAFCSNCVEIQSDKMEFRKTLRTQIVSVILILNLTSHLCYATTLSKLGAFSIKNPAFTILNKNSDAVSAKDEFTLFISTFAGPTIFSSNKDSVQMVRRVGSLLNNLGSIVPEVITTDVTWPNEISVVPGKKFINGLH